MHVRPAQAGLALSGTRRSATMTSDEAGSNRPAVSRLVHARFEALSPLLPLAFDCKPEIDLPAPAGTLSFPVILPPDQAGGADFMYCMGVQYGPTVCRP
ncbi:hypothetical protein P3T23_007331 [Paraburkholderia sp. GAS448]